MINRIVAACCTLVLALSIEAATVEYSPKGVVSFMEATPFGDFTAVFKKCLANEIFTFSTVRLDGVRVNEGDVSDNVGPLLVDGKWVGANHLDSQGDRTARTLSVEVALDGNAIDPGKDLTTSCNVMTVRVRNQIDYAADEPFAIENVTYTVAGNSIEVEVELEFVSSVTRTINNYYGMQSMFKGEKEILLPGSGLAGWQPVGSDEKISFTKADAPDFHLFVEKNGNFMQASYLLPEKLGLHSGLQDWHPIFIRSSLGKSYHRMMCGTAVSAGDVAEWHGVYSWFNAPVEDTLSTAGDNGCYSYTAYIEGNPMIVSAKNDGTLDVKPFSSSAIPVIMEIEGETMIYDICGRVVSTDAETLPGKIPAGVYIIIRHDHPSKILVR